MSLDSTKTVSKFEYEITTTTTILVSDRNILYDSSGNKIQDSSNNDVTSRHYS